MNSTYTSGLTALALATLLGACGAAKETKVGQVVELNGDRQTECSTEIGIAVGGLGSRQQEMNINGTNITLSTRLYADDKCAKPVSEVEYKGSFKVGDEIAGKPGVRPLDITIDSVTAMARSEGSQDWRNLIDSCGVHDWTINAPRDVTGLDCSGSLGNFPAKGTVFMTAYKLEGNNVLFGKMPCEDEDSCKTTNPTPAESDHDRDFDLGTRYIPKS